MADAEPAKLRAALLLRVFAVALAFMGMLAVVFVAMDRPRTYSCEGEPPPEAANARAGYVPAALVVVGIFGAGFALVAWRWAAERAARLGRVPRPRPLTLTFMGGALALWIAILADALTDERAGGPYLYAFLLGGAGLILCGVLVLLLLFHVAFVRPDSRNWAARCETFAVAATWVLLLAVVPAAAVFAAVSGRDVTLFC